MAYIEKRTLKNGAARFIATVRVRGFPTQSATFDKQSMARDWARGIENDMRAGRYGGEIVSRKYTVAQMVDRYIASVLESKTDNIGFIAKQRQQLEWWKVRIGDCQLSNLTPFIINDCKEELAGRNYSVRSPGTVNCYLSAFNHVINTAIKEWGWISTNPISKITKPKEPRGRVRYLIEKERQDLLLACKREMKKPLYLIVLLALCTGARKSEILGIKRKDVDFKRRVAVVYDTKNGEPRQLYLSDITCSLLKEWMDRRKHTKPRLVFPRRGDSKEPINIEAEWRRALKRAGIEDFRFHDLRHTAASYMAMNGASPSDIAEALGHKSYDMVKRYSHLSTTHVGNVVRSMNEKVLASEGEQDNAA